MKPHNFSIEFFPPKTAEGSIKLKAVRQQLAQLHPAYFSVTFGAGGVTQQGTIETVLDIHEAGCTVAPHISCIGSTRTSIRAMLETYQQKGIRRLVALRGDIPSGYGTGGEFRYAYELVHFIRETTQDWFTIEIAAYPEMHPQAGSLQKDIVHFIHKIKAGANGAITQYFYNPDAYFYFVESVAKEGVFVPIVPGIMPITNYTQLSRFSEMCGAEIPRWLRLKLIDYADDKASLQSYGREVVSRLCERLLTGGAPGLHIYSMNQASAVEAIWQSLS